MSTLASTITATFALVIIAFGTHAHQSEVNAHHVAQALCTMRIVGSETEALNAKAAYVYDVKTGHVVFEKNEDAQLALASITKLATVLVASETLSANETVVITDDAFTPEGDSGFTRGETWRAEDLIDFTLMTSSNDGARALALHSAGSVDDFIARMNTLAKEIGLAQTYFLNETGLDSSIGTAGAYGSARDVAHLLAYAYNQNGAAYNRSTQSASVYTSLSGITHNVEHTSTVAGNLPGELIVKTGFTDLAGGNLAVLTELMPGRPVAIVVLGATRESRDTDTLLLSELATHALKRATLCQTL